MTAVKNRRDPADLARRLCNVLDFATQTVQQLAGKGFTHPADPNYNVPPEKIIGETAFIMLAASAAGAYIEVEDKIDKLACMVIPYARSQETLFNICLHPALALDFAHPHICLTKLGYSDNKFDMVLAKAVDCYAHYGCERTPYRMIEQQWMRRIWNNSDTACVDLLSHTLLSRPIDLLNGTRDDRYAFTHALIYASDLNDVPLQLSRKTAELLDEVDAMLAAAIDQQDYDLTSELLLSWPIMGEEWSTSSVFAFRVLAEIEDEVGFLPSPGIHRKIPPGMEYEQRKKYLVGTTYHTLYVMGLLCSVILKHQRNPPLEIPCTHTIQGSANKIMPFIEQHDDAPYWLRVYRKLSRIEKDSLSSFLFDIALTRNSRKNNYDNLYKLLIIGHELGLTGSAIARQTAELLERISMLSVISGQQQYQR